MYNRK